MVLHSDSSVVSRSGNEASSMTDCFVGSVVEGLPQKEQEHKAVRDIAGRALANIASDDR